MELAGELVLLGCLSLVPALSLSSDLGLGFGRFLHVLALLLLSVLRPRGWHLGCARCWGTGVGKLRSFAPELWCTRRVRVAVCTWWLFW